MQHSSITLEVYFRKVWKLLLRRLHHSDDIRVKSYVRIILGHPILGDFYQFPQALTYTVCREPVHHSACDLSDPLTDLERMLQLAMGDHALHHVGPVQAVDTVGAEHPVLHPRQHPVPRHQEVP